MQHQQNQISHNLKCFNIYPVAKDTCGHFSFTYIIHAIIKEQVFVYIPYMNVCSVSL